MKVIHLQKLLGLEMPKYQLPLNNPDPKGQAEVKAAIQNNFAKAEIFYKTLNVELKTQNPEYTVRSSIRDFF